MFSAAAAAAAASAVARRCSSQQNTYRVLIQCRRRPPQLRTSSSSTTNTTAKTTADAAVVAGRARPVRRANVSKDERAALRRARKERAAQMLQQGSSSSEGAAATSSAAATGAAGEAAAATAAATTTTTTTGAAAGASQQTQILASRYVWYLGVGIPTGLLFWGLNDEDSPPARFSELIGLTGLIKSYTDPIALPAHEKLLPDWSQMPNVPQDLPPVPTLVLDLENTLVATDWNRKYGYRFAKRPGVDKFLREMAQYYEIVLYSPSMDSVADPVVTSLDKEGCIMHRLYRDATHYYKGAHVKDLARLNRDVNRIIVIDDDPAEVQLNPENLIRIKPYDDPTDRTDNTLTRITPFLLEIAREGYSDFPELLQQYRGMDADGIADEQERRLDALRDERARRSRQGLAGLGNRSRDLPAPELPPVDPDVLAAGAPQQLTAKDIAGMAPTGGGGLGDATEGDGLVGWMARRAKEKQEHQMRKAEKWEEVMRKRQQQKMEEEEATARAAKQQGV